MKREIFILCLMFSAGYSHIWAENKKEAVVISVPVPTELGVFFSFDENTLSPLEQTSGVTKTKGGTGAFLSGLVTAGTVMTKIKEVIVVKGASSSVRVNSARPVFLFKVVPGLDIKTYELMAFKSLKNRRELTAAEIGGVLGVQSTDGYPTIPFSIEAHPTDSQTLVIRPKVDLVPGEYGFSPKGSAEVQCFRVDMVTK